MFKKTPTFPPSKQLIGIQYLRGIAVLFVILDHTTAMSALPKYFGTNLNIFNGFFESGGVGVDLFFVISGFIIFFVALNNNSLTPKLDAPTFFRHRFIRIIPFLWVCIIATALLKMLGRGTFPIWEYIRSMTLFPIGVTEPRPVWTLRNEFLFYSLFGFFIIYLRNKWAWLILWFLSPVLWYGLGINNLLPPSALRELGDFIFGVHNLTFGIGFFIGFLYKKGYLNYELASQTGLLLCLGVAAPLLIIAHLLGMNAASTTFPQVLSCGIYSGLVVVLGITIISNKPLNFIDRFGLTLGNASYAIYLTHSMVISALLGILSKHSPHINPLILLITIGVAALIVGILAHYYVEKPLIKLIKDKMEKDKSAKILVSDKAATFK